MNIDEKEPAQAEEPKYKYEEPAYAKEKLERGEFAIGYFGGQTLLFIPKSVANALGVQRIRTLADGIFGKELDEFFVLMNNEIYKLSCSMELPPQENRESNKVTELIQAIRNAIK